MIDLSKTPEEIKEDLIELFIANADYYQSRTIDCAIIMAKGMISVCPEEITEMSGDLYSNPNYVKLVKVLGLLGNR